MADDLLDIRQQFIKRSGRYDLATTTVDEFDTDAGADDFINAGSRWLDLHQEHLVDTQEFVVTLSASGYQIDMTQLRTPKEVYYLNGTTGKNVQLLKRSMEWMLDQYPKLGSETPSLPKFWAPYISHRAPAQKASGAAYNTKRVVVMPPTAASLDVSVFGRFHQPKLESNTDTNFWSMEYPTALVMAALMVVEGFYRNTAGVRDYREFIDDILIGIDRDTADLENTASSRMEG